MATFETNKIEELAQGVYWVMLWCPEAQILNDLLDPEAPFVLCWDHDVGNYAWQEFSLPVIEPSEPISLFSRVANFDFILPTQRFREILPRMPAAIKAVQLGSMPPDYFDLRRIKGKQLYRLLAECGWHIFLDTPANDFGQMMSPDPKVLERAIEIMRMTDQTHE